MPISPLFEGFLSNLAQHLHTGNAMGLTDDALDRSVSALDQYFAGLPAGDNRPDPQQSLLAGLWRVSDAQERAALTRSLIKYVAKSDDVTAV